MQKPKTSHPTTGEIVVRDLASGKVKEEDLAKHIDKLLNKELIYGIHLGKEAIKPENIKKHLDRKR